MSEKCLELSVPAGPSDLSMDANTVLPLAPDEVIEVPFEDNVIYVTRS